jgi:lysophospholipase L1-like esterase
MGINGSSTVQYLKSSGFENQIHDINADLVILSFGTNDTYMPTSSFCARCAKDRYGAIIDRIRTANPDLPILLTTPPDHYYLRRYSNKNLKALIVAMYELCDEKNVAIWDLNAIMGGENSIVTWRNNGWARGDLIHFTSAGYQKQGDMLYDAIMHHYQEQ